MKFKYLFIIILYSSFFSQSQESISEKNSLASAYIDAGLYDDAITIYENILDIQINILGNTHIELVNTLYKLADVHVLNNNLNIAEDYAKQAVKIQELQLLIYQKQYIPSFDRLKNIYYLKNDTLKIQEFDSLIAILHNLDKNDSLFFSNDTTIHHIPKIKTFYMDSIDSTNLVSEYSINDQAIEFIDKGFVYLDMGFFSEAAREFDFALKLNSKIISLDYLLNLDFSDSIMINNFYDTLYDIEQYDSTNTTSKLFLSILGLKKEVDDSIIINHINEYIHVNPEDIKSFLLLANLAIEDSLYIDAVGYLHRALLINPSNIQANYNLGVSLMKLNKYEDAVIQFEKVIKLDMNHKEARFNAS